MTAWLLSILIAIAPPGRSPARESREAGEARYADIAAAVAHAVEDVPPLPGAQGRERLALVVLAVGWHESGFRLDVDAGANRGDSGRSWGIWQAQVGRGKTADGWTGPELVGSHKLAALAAVHAIRRSMQACRSRGWDGQLRAYASGSCDRGEVESAAMMGAARRWFARWPPPKETP